MIKKVDGGIVVTDVHACIWNDVVAHWHAYITCEEVSEVFSSLTYDSNIQRGHEVVKVSDNVTKNKPLIDDKHVDKMIKVLKAGSMLPGVLTWNVRLKTYDDTDSCYIYNEEDNTLFIKSKHITMPDSAHRTNAIARVMEDLTVREQLKDNQFPLHIYALTARDERRFFVNNNGKQKSVSSNRIKFLTDDRECEFLRQLIECSDLKGKVETMYQNRYTDGHIVKFEVLHHMLFGDKGILKGVDINNPSIFNDEKNQLKKFFNGLLKARPEFDLYNADEIKLEKRTSLFLDPTVWEAYAMIYMEYPDLRGYEMICKKLLNHTIRVEGAPNPIPFFSKQNEDWHGYVIPRGYDHFTQTTVRGNAVTNNSGTRKKIAKMFYRDVIEHYKDDVDPYEELLKKRNNDDLDLFNAEQSS